MAHAASLHQRASAAQPIRDIQLSSQAGPAPAATTATSNLLRRPLVAMMRSERRSKRGRLSPIGSASVSRVRERKVSQPRASHCHAFPRLSVTSPSVPLSVSLRSGVAAERSTGGRSELPHAHALVFPSLGPTLPNFQKQHAKPPSSPPSPTHS